MPKIGLSETWSLIPKGVHVFQIVGASYKEAYGKLEITMKTARGQRHVERFGLAGKNGERNQGALNAFSYFARAALNDFDRQDVDPEELVGRYIRCTVDHEEVPGKDDPAKTYKFVRLTDKEPADGFDEPPRKTEEKPSGSGGPAGTGGPAFDLDSLLG